ncbi:hypothetical protein [Flavobacterium aquidurense]|uniref:hypothetical protein n=1 Tax=Flavobacterium aquidurense TaxID=362413 RepID=UPI00285F9BBD|nr:hypothetical protein [Flavobacterium aquidurense]MDR7370017.1 hypothetical protein [Flavobacterium aquidurense]
MKNLFSLLIISLFWFSANAQTTAEISSENTLPALQSDSESDLDQDYNAEELPWHARRFKFTAGGFFPVNNTQVEVGKNDGSFGTEIDFENDLGFKRNTASFMGTFEWRISRRSRAGFEYFYLRRTSSKVLERDIEFGDNTYHVNTRVSALMDNQILRVTYSYAFLSKPKYEVGLLIGAHILLGDIGLKFEGTTAQAEYNDSFNFTAPLPDVGIFGDFVLGKKFGLYANANYFALKVNDIDGKLTSFNLSLLYNVYKNFSLTAGYTGLFVDVDVEKEKLNGYFKWGYNGPTLTATYTFGDHISFVKK